MCPPPLSFGAFAVLALAAFGASSLFDLVLVGIVWLWIRRRRAPRR